MLANFFPSMADPTKDTENEDAMPIVVQAKMFLEMVHADEIGGGLYTHTVSVSHEDEAVANSRLQKVENAIANTQTLTARTDAKSLAAWLGSIPGHPYADLGRMPISSATLADVLPMTKPWAGQKHDTHFNAPALLRCKSTGGNPFFLSMHQDAQPLGHFLFIADSRAGKSTALSSFVAAFRQYDNSRIVLLDRFGSSRVITYALGGQFYDLGKPGSVSLQPLARVDDPYELTVANEWIVRRVEEQHRAASPESQKEITSALKIIGSRAPRFRTLSNFRTQVQDNDVKLAISPYCKGGAHGDLLDNSELRVGLDNDVIAYEMAALFERQAAFPAVLENIFHEISRKFDGRPTLFAVDEAWAFIDKISTADKLGGFLRESGKKNVSIILSTQTPMEIAQSKLAPVIAATIKQRIFGAMSNAREKQTAQILRDLRSD